MHSRRRKAACRCILVAIPLQTLVPPSAIAARLPRAPSAPLPSPSFPEVILLRSAILLSGFLHVFSCVRVTVRSQSESGFHSAPFALLLRLCGTASSWSVIFSLRYGDRERRRRQGVVVFWIFRIRRFPSLWSWWITT